MESAVAVSGTLALWHFGTLALWHFGTLVLKRSEAETIVALRTCWAERLGEAML